MADPDRASVRIERYEVTHGWYSRPTKRVRIVLTRRTAYGSNIETITMSVAESVLLKALKAAGYTIETNFIVERVP